MHVPTEVLFTTQLLSTQPEYILLSCIGYVSLLQLEGEYVLFLLLSLYLCIVFHYDKTIVIASLLYLNLKISAPLFASCMLLNTDIITRICM